MWQGKNADLLLSITGSTGCGSSSLRNALAYSSPKNVSEESTLVITQALTNGTTVIFFVPVFLSSSLMMHSSPLLTTLRVPSQAHLLTFHSSALVDTHGLKNVTQALGS
jgi:predicted ATPase